MKAEPIVSRNLSFKTLPLGQSSPYILLEVHLQSPDLLTFITPGQFFMLYPSDNESGNTAFKEFFLPRPFTVFDVRGSSILFLVKVRGRFTQALKEGKVCRLNLVGPLGNGWKYSPFKSNLLVGAGSGVASLLMLASSMHKKPHLLASFTRKSELSLLEPFRDFVSSMDVAVWEDGRDIFDLLSSREEHFYGRFDTIFVCVPSAVVSRVIDFFRNVGYPLNMIQFSLEAMMGCGFGGCGSCMITVVRNGERRRVKVCKDGPVFTADEIGRTL